MLHQMAGTTKQRSIKKKQQRGGKMVQFGRVKEDNKNPVSIYTLIKTRREGDA